MIKIKKKKTEPKVSAGSMADIAFLLLIFFLVATTLMQEKGIMMQLPPDVPPTNVHVKDRNLFRILINSKDQFLIEGEVRKDLDGLEEEVKTFVMNPEGRPVLAETPKEAIISIKAQRGAKYASFIKTLDAVKEAYYQLYGERVGLSSAEFRRLDREEPRQNEKYVAAREGLPMNISIAEPDKPTK